MASGCPLPSPLLPSVLAPAALPPSSSRGHDFIVDEMERSIHDSLCVVKRVLESNQVVPGGGAVETALSIYLENFATSIVSHLLLISQGQGRWVGQEWVEWVGGAGVGGVGVGGL